MEKVKLVDIAEFIKTGKTPPTSQSKYFDGKINWYTPGDFRNGKNLSKSNRTLTELSLVEKKAVVFPKNTLLITCIGDIGKLGITYEDCSSNQQITGLKPKENVDVHYLYYWFLVNKKKIESTANNAVVAILNNKTLQNIDFEYPSLATQQKIAAILDKADELRQYNKQLIEKYEALTQSLFLEMFGDVRMNSSKFPVFLFDEISNKITDGDHLTPKREEIGYKLLSCRNIKNGFIDFSAGLDYVGESEFQRMFKRCNPEKGDILISCSGTIGRTTSIKIDEPFVLVRSAALIKPKRDLVNPFYLEFYLRTDYMQSVMKRSANTSSQANLFTGPIKKLPIILPPFELQTQFSNRVQLIETQKQQAQEALAKSEDLFQGLLQQAFKGELN